MLKAITHSKAGRVSHNDQKSIRWGDLYKQHEDLMTAAVLGRFAYLSEPVQNRILSSWFSTSIFEDSIFKNTSFENNTNEEGQSFFGFKEILFWPKYRLEDGRQVEPDVLLVFEHCHILIEIKPPQGGDQYFEQWQREVQAFLYNDDSQLPLHFLAIGRISKPNSMAWFSQLKTEHNQLDKTAALFWQDATNTISELVRNTTNLLKTDQRILADILDALALYGLHTHNFDWSDLITITKPKADSKKRSLSLQSTVLIGALKQGFGLSSGPELNVSRDLPSIEKSDQRILTFQQLFDYITNTPNLDLKGISTWNKL